MSLIGLNGASRSGKDSVAQILVRKYDFRQVALATAIRDILLDLDPLIICNDGNTVFLKELYSMYSGDWDKIKAASSDSVEYMIRLGQSARNIISEDVWINAAFSEINFPEGFSNTNIVVSDIRQPNEVEYIHRFGGELWKIERPNSEQRGMDGLLKGVNFDAHVYNDGTLQTLEEKVDWIIEHRGV